VKRGIHSYVLRTIVDAGAFRCLCRTHSAIVCTSLALRVIYVYLSELVVVNAHTSLRAVVHGKRGCFACPMTYFQYQVGLALSQQRGGGLLLCRCSCSMLPTDLGRFGARRFGRAGARVFLVWWSPSTGSVQCGGTARASCLLVGVCTDRLTTFAVVFG
jgi:hypothetical protein